MVADPSPAEPAEAACRAQYDSGPNPMPHTRIVRCDLPSGHAGDHAELIGGEIGATWDVPGRINAEDCRGCTGVPMGYPYVCPGGAGHGPRPVDTAPADDVPDELLASVAQAMLPWDEGLTAGINLFEWHRCPTCPRGDQPCSCAGIPWPSEPVRVALDYVWHAARAPLAAEVDRLRAQLAIVTEDRKARTLERDRLVDTLTAARAELAEARAGYTRAGHEWDRQRTAFRADLANLEATQAATDRRLLEAEAERDQARASLAGAAALPEGGMWATDYGHDPALITAHGIEWHPGLHCVRDTYRRRVWYGRTEPVGETEATGG